VLASAPLTYCILRQGKALVRTIEALSTIEPSGPIERAAARLQLYVYKRRLRGVVGDGGGKGGAVDGREPRGPDRTHRFPVYPPRCKTVCVKLHSGLPQQPQRSLLYV
jgi:hypothetical protein